MKKYIPILMNTQMFNGLIESEIESMLPCLKAKLISYKKGEYVLHQGDIFTYIAVLTEGKLHIQNDDYWGNRSILGQVDVGEMFGEAYASAGNVALINDVVAIKDSEVIYFDVNNILGTCASNCKFHTRVVQNMFSAISAKNIRLVQKLAHMSRRTTREKLTSYLSEQSKYHKSSNFSISFNRQQLADFLSVDRSAMSNELCKMRDEGMIKFDRNNFILLD